MQIAQCVLFWFCIGWTAVTFPLSIVVAALAVCAKISAAVHSKSLQKLLCEQKQDTESKQ